MNIFQPSKDSDIRNKIRIFFNDCISNDENNLEILIKLGNSFWMSANSLSLILTFIESIMIKRSTAKIYIDLFDQDTVSHILSNEYNLEEINVIEFINRMRFYEAMQFAEILFKYHVNVYPNYDNYIAMREALAAVPEKRLWLHSAKILYLNKLIEDELQQRTLSDRIAIMANILKNNLFLRVDQSEAQEDSEQIMFELIKNIYQHSKTVLDDKYLNSGFTCAQINKYPLLNIPKVNPELLNDLFYKEQSRNEKQNWKYLSITINDFGVGLAEKLRSDLRNKLNGQMLEIGRFKIDKEFIQDDSKLIELAVTTNFTTKSYDRTIEKFLEKKLVNRGYGYIFCMAFIAKNFGRMEVSSGRVKLLFMAKPTALFEDCWHNMTTVSDLLQNHFEKYFEISTIQLTSEESRFPGTQLLIEIPVNPYR